MAGDRQPPVPSPDGARWAWAYFGPSAERFYRLRRELAGSADFIETGPLVNEILDEYSRELVGFDECLSIRDPLLWHSTNLAERNPFASPFIFQCAATLAFERLLNRLDQHLLVLTDDVDLARALAAQAHRRGVPARLVGPPGAFHRLAASGAVRLTAALRTRAAFLRAVRRERRLLARSRVPESVLRDGIDLLLVTWAEPSSFSPDRRTERDTYFGDLPALARLRGLRVGYLAMPAVWVHPLEDIARSVASAGDPVLTPSECIRLRTALSICWRTMHLPARRTKPFVVGDIDLSALLDRELRREVSLGRRLWAMQFAYVGKELAVRGARPARVLFPYENQSWEKSLRLGLHANAPQTRVAGYQHTPFSTSWLSYFPSDRDIRDGGLPDEVVVIGERWREILVAHGYPEQCLSIGSALRFDHLPNRTEGIAAPNPREAGRTPRILVAASIGFNDSVELVGRTVEALGMERDMQVLVKLHPKCGFGPERLVAAIGDALGGAALIRAFAFTNTPIADLLPTVDVLLHNTTSVAYEALAVGVPTVFVSSSFWLDLDPLPRECDVCRRATTADDLRDAVREALAESPEMALKRRTAATAIVEQTFTSVTDEGLAALLGVEPECRARR